MITHGILNNFQGEHMKISNKLCLVFLMSLMMTGFAFAKKGKMGGGFKQILKQLDLTKEQQEKLKALKDDDGEDWKKTRAEMKENRDKMKEAFKSSSSEADVRKLHESIKATRIQKMDRRFDKMMKIRSVLTPEQRVKFIELQDKQFAKRRPKKKM